MATDNDQQKLANELHSRVVDQIRSGGSDAEAFCDDRCLKRYLAARRWNVDEASKLLHKTLEWRRKTKPANIICTLCQQDPYSHNLRQVGFDAEGRPVIYTAFSQAKNRFDPEENSKHLIMALERAAAIMNRRLVDKWIWVVDFHGFSMRDCNPMNALRAADLLSHYPERLHQVLLLDAPTLFAGTWRALRAVLDEVTANKIAFVPLADMEKRFAACFPEELREWLCAEARENREPRCQHGGKAYWEWLDDQGRPLAHDPRGTASYVTCPDYIAMVSHTRCRSALMVSAEEAAAAAATGSTLAMAGAAATAAGAAATAAAAGA